MRAAHVSLSTKVYCSFRPTVHMDDFIEESNSESWRQRTGRAIDDNLVGDPALATATGILWQQAPVRPVAGSLDPNSKVEPTNWASG